MKKGTSKLGEGVNKIGKKMIPGLGVMFDFLDFFLNPDVVEAPTSQELLEKQNKRLAPEIFIEPNATQKDKFYNSYLNSRNRMG